MFIIDEFSFWMIKLAKELAIMTYRFYFYYFKKFPLIFAHIQFFSLDYLYLFHLLCY